MWYTGKSNDQCQGYDVKSWRHARRQTCITSISETTHPRTIGLVSISGFSKSGNPVKWNSSMWNQCMSLTSRHDSWRHAWRQTYIRTISGTTYPRTLTLVPISRFSKSGNPTKYILSVLSQWMTSYVTLWRHAWRHSVKRDVKLR